MTLDVIRLDAATLGAKIAAGEVSSAEVTQACLDQIAATDERYPAFLHVAAEQALAAAARQGQEQLLAGFLLGDRAFLARPHPKRAPRSRDYDHLARVAEWNQADADAE